MRRDKWPAALYDYERGAIADGEVEELDLTDGVWLRCRCCDRVLKTRGAFDGKRWGEHNNTIAHRNHAAEESREQSADESSEYDDFASAMIESIEKDTDYLVLYRAEADRRAKEQVQTKELVRRMALLVAEQHEDMEVLRDEVDELKDIVSELDETIQYMRRQNQEHRGGRLHKKRRLHYGGEFSPSRRLSSVLQKSRGAQVRVIDMFDDEVQLTQID